MRNLTTLSRRALLAVSLAMISACNAAPPAAQQRVIEGVLVMKGSLPHSVPVLQTDSGNWELIGVDADQVKQLQRQRVTVTGQPLPSEPPQRPQLQVERIELTSDR